MSELAAVSLGELRDRARVLRSPAALARLARSLARDRRRGARALAARIERRIAEERAERRRLAGLFARARRLRADGVARLAGVDEVGVGPLAGPVVACAVVLPAAVELPGLDDSKQLAPARREALAAAIREQAVALSLAEASPAEIDRLNIYHATLEAMRRAVLGLSAAPDHVLVDARTIPGLGVPQTAVVGGDGSDGCIAAASIVAKVHRDDLMRRAHERHPGYGFDRHMGYGTPEHLDALARLGPTALHRRSFAPVAKLTR